MCNILLICKPAIYIMLILMLWRHRGRRPMAGRLVARLSRVFFFLPRVDSYFNIARVNTTFTPCYAIELINRAAAVYTNTMKWSQCGYGVSFTMEAQARTTCCSPQSNCLQSSISLVFQPNHRHRFLELFFKHIPNN